MIKKTYCEEQTEELGQQLSDNLKPGDVLALYGDLGSGKTAFTRGVCRGLGCIIDVSSPTFNIINFYPGDIEVAHVDLYRIECDLDEIGWYELFEQKRIIIVEWAEKAKNDLPQKHFDVFFEVIDFKTREIRIVTENDSGN